MKNQLRENENSRNYTGKKAEPSVEELIFIYSRLEKRSDGEILEEMQDESFPLRSSGFMKRRRRDFQAAKTVLKERIEAVSDPVVVEAKKQHLNEVGDLLSRWQKELEEFQQKRDYEAVCKSESSSLFPMLLEHCPGVIRVFYDYDTPRKEYNRIEAKLFSESCPEIPSAATGAYRKVAIYAASCITMGDDYPRYSHRMFVQGAKAILEIDDLSFTIAEWDISSSNYKTDHDLGRYADLHRELVSKYVGDPRIKKLYRIRKNLKDLQKILLAAIIAGNDSKSYIKNECRICPDKGT